MHWWHYTLGATLISILADRGIRRTGAAVRRGERRAVWFSCRCTWEPTATKGIVENGINRFATIEEMVYAGGVLARIEVPESVARYTWAQHLKLGGIDLREADALEAAARECGADPSEWRVNYRDVPLAEVIRVEASLDGIAWHHGGEPSADGLGFVPDFFDRIKSSPMIAKRDHAEKGGS